MTDSPDRVPPQDLEAEQSTLGSMLIEPGAADHGAQILQPEDFYRDAHKAVFGAITTVQNRDEPVDLVTVSAELRRVEKLDAVGGPEYLTALIDNVPTAAHVVRYAQIVQEKATLRRLIEAGGRIAGLGYDNPEDADGAVDQAEQWLNAVGDRRLTREYVPIAEPAKVAFERADARYRGEGAVLTGVETGIRDLDNFLGGLQPATLVTVAGRPGMGKSSLAACNFALHAASKQGVPVGIFSLEESALQLAEATIAAEARCNAWKLRHGVLKPDEWHRVGKAMAVVSNAKIVIDDTPGISVMELRAKARRMRKQHEVGLLVIDYLQLASAGGKVEQGYAEVTVIVRSLKNLARELNIPVVACSQLSRRVEHREGREKRPILSDLLQSGAIEADSDVVLFVYRPEYYQRREEKDAPRPPPSAEEEAEIIIAKHRAGPTGTINCRFVGAQRRFYDAPRGGRPEEPLAPVLQPRDEQRPPLQEPVPALVGDDDLFGDE